VPTLVTGGAHSLRPILRDLSFICPDCRHALQATGTSLECASCGRSYPVADGRPDFVGNPAPEPPISPASGSRLRRRLATLPPHPSRPTEPVDSDIHNDHGVLRRFLASIDSGHKLLDLGSGRRRLAPNVVTTDVAAWPEVDVVADAHRLPFAEASFDAIVLQAVIEHVLDPIQLLEEARRALRPGGRIYVEAPFLYPEHDEHDYRRWTRRGLEVDVGRHFEVLESGIVIGPAPVLSMIWRAFLNLKLERLHWAPRNLLAWSTAWLRDLDRRPPEGTPPIYGMCYVVGRAGGQ
jgi:SAM-dependent methyltransferase